MHRLRTLFVKYCVIRGRSDKLRQLLKQNRINDAIAYSLLSDAVKENRPELVSVLLESGLEVNVTNQAGMSLLMVACLISGPRIVKELLKAGAKPNALDPEYRNALDHAAGRLWGSDSEITEIVRMLLDAGAVPGKRALEIAI